MQHATGKFKYFRIKNAPIKCREVCLKKGRPSSEWLQTVCRILENHNCGTLLNLPLNPPFKQLQTNKSSRNKKMANTTILIELQKKLLSKQEEDNMAKNDLQEKLANKKDDKIV